ncbi:MAG: TIGR03643 family protein [Legionellales bacterium]|nr:TIGR03643 family protein [Legionellales bacterium]OUX66976.1 MAG: TIGR03643 family protein [bacterium TMED178]
MIIDESQTGEIIEMAWKDDVAFEDIERITGFNESEVIQLMRRELKPSSFKLWRKRVTGRDSKHRKKQNRKQEQ